MAQHDYINRQPKTRQSAKNKKNAQVSQRKPFPVFLSIAAVILITGFTYGLWYIKTNADPGQVNQAQMPKTVAKKIDTAPEKPRDPEFLEEIRNHEVKVDVKEIKRNGPYQMQCASLRTYPEAEALKAKMAFAGLIAEIKRTEGSNGVWYRVRLGPYDSKRKAESDKNKLKRIHIIGCAIWGWT
ncbi:SPOR domain-containing protein [Pseudoalteromonas sp. MMG013]|uniref:SPOR domain-containing protein n=1 Tax=unclassified Pseudoalteromonas TaxID=194690 RepID=UPI001B387AE3|nr:MULTISPECIES: SPOR domain-containing protein [unclassified Pseudoalteromonas]MBQ4848010.1 SPOR domain-containing protein [Pseudoalteromonas sp. MMG005]MBQ4863847.1 SPOR domain-containing protein [Pseudoalteromonas sp. MMG013]